MVTPVLSRPARSLQRGRCRLGVSTGSVRAARTDRKTSTTSVARSLSGQVGVEERVEDLVDMLAALDRRQVGPDDERDIPQLLVEKPRTRRRSALPRSPTLPPTASRRRPQDRRQRVLQQVAEPALLAVAHSGRLTLATAAVPRTAPHRLAVREVDLLERPQARMECTRDFSRTRGLRTVHDEQRLLECPELVGRRVRKDPLEGRSRGLGRLRLCPVRLVVIAESMGRGRSSARRGSRRRSGDAPTIGS